MALNFFQITQLFIGLIAVHQNQLLIQVSSTGRLASLALLRRTATSLP
jgi:hypothetical protein